MRATAVVCVAMVLVVGVASCSGASTGSATLASASTSAIGTALAQPEALAFDHAGNLYISEFAGHFVDRVDPEGGFTRFAGTGVEGYSGDGGPALDAELNMPTGLLFQPDGQLVIADHRNHCIRRVDVAGVISRIAGTCTKHGEKGDGGPALDAKMNDPIGITLDEKGDLIIADEQNGVVRKVDPSGTISLFAGGGTIPVETAPNGTRATDLQLSHPSYVLADGAGDVYLSDFLANVVIEIGRDGRITRIAGTGVEGFSGDCGKATAARLDFPTGLARDTHGRLFISDASNNRVRMVDQRGYITTVAGSGPTGLGNGSYAGDGGPAIKAKLNAPAGLAFDVEGNLFISDQGNDRVRMVNPAGEISLVAGLPAGAADVSPEGILASGKPRPGPDRAPC